jgi:hypothetical protein
MLPHYAIRQILAREFLQQHTGQNLAYYFLLKTPFLAFDDNYGFLALSAGVWTMAKMRDGAQWLSNHYAANETMPHG